MTRAVPTVDSVDATAYTVATDGPEADGTLAWDSTTLVLVRVRAGGAVGTGWTYGPAACVRVVDDLLGDVVTGRDAMAVEQAWSAMVAALRNAGRPGVAGMALSATDCALWDLKARLLDLPLHRLLGSVHPDVPVYGSGGFTTYGPDRLAQQLGGWVHEQHIPRVKIKIGESWGSREDRDLDRVEQARQVIGGDTELYVDANGGYSVAQARRVERRMRPLDVRWFEEPVSSDHLDQLRAVRRSSTADVAAGEYGYHLAYFQQMCAARAVDCLQADVTRCGGITELLRVAAVAAAHGLQVSGHCAPNQHASVLAAVPNLRHLEWFHDHVRIESMLLEGSLDPTGGTVRPRDAAGHGMTWLDGRAEPYRVA